VVRPPAGTTVLPRLHSFLTGSGVQVDYLRIQWLPITIASDGKGPGPEGDRPYRHGGGNKEGMGLAF
jgi:hypothetical protein